MNIDLNSAVNNPLKKEITCFIFSCDSSLQAIMDRQADNQMNFIE